MYQQNLRIVLKDPNILPVVLCNNHFEYNSHNARPLIVRLRFSRKR